MGAWQKLGVYAAGLALTDAGLKGDKERLGEMELIVAAGGGERDYTVDELIFSGITKSNAPNIYLNERLINDVRPTLFLAQLSNLLAGNISIVHGLTGASCTLIGEEQAGIDALRVAVARIGARQGDIFLVGCCGERGDDFHRTRSSPDGAPIIAAMRRAIADASISPDTIDYVNAHGTSTPENDKMEAMGLMAVIGERMKTVPISSNKSMIGHTLAAAGAVEAVASLLTIAHGKIPPTINYAVPDPAIPLDVVPNIAWRFTVCHRSCVSLTP